MSEKHTDFFYIKIEHILPKINLITILRIMQQVDSLDTQVSIYMYTCHMWSLVLLFKCLFVHSKVSFKLVGLPQYVLKLCDSFSQYGICGTQPSAVKSL